jgi:hypothetical protein
MSRSNPPIELIFSSKDGVFVTYIALILIETGIIVAFLLNRRILTALGRGGIRPHRVLHQRFESQTWCDLLG